MVAGTSACVWPFSIKSYKRNMKFSTSRANLSKLASSIRAIDPMKHSLDQLHILAVKVIQTLNKRQNYFLKIRLCIQPFLFKCKCLTNK